MQVTENVVKDLLPLYLAGEASSDTVRLVEEYLEAHPELRGLAAISTEALPAIDAPADLERRSLELTRSLLAWKNRLLALAGFFTLLPLTILVKDNRVEFLLFRDLPVVGGLLLLVALGLWGGFLHVSRRLRDTGLPAPRSWGVRVGWYFTGCAIGVVMLLVIGELGASEFAAWRRVRSFVVVMSGLLAVWIGERLNRVATVDQLHRPVTLFDEDRRQSR